METVIGFFRKGNGQHQAHQEIQDYLAGREQERERIAAEVQAEADRFWDGLLTEASEEAAG